MGEIFISLLKVLLWIWHKLTFHKKALGKIVIVEDNPQSAKLLHLYIVKCGRQATIEETAEAAVSRIYRNDIGIIFVDMRLEHMQGWQLVEMIFQTSPHTLVVITCTELEDVLKIKGKLNAFMVLVKPIGFEMVQSVFERIKV